MTEHGRGARAGLCAHHRTVPIHLSQHDSSNLAGALLGITGLKNFLHCVLKALLTYFCFLSAYFSYALHNKFLEYLILFAIEFLSNLTWQTWR